MEAIDKQAAERLALDFVAALRPLNVRHKAMFGGYCVWVDDKVVAIITDGVYLKRSERDDLLSGWASLGFAYDCAKESWLLPAAAVEADPERVRSVVAQVADVLPLPKKRKKRA